MTTLDVKAIRARLASATPGPWEWHAAGLDDDGALQPTNGEDDALFGHVSGAGWVRVLTDGSARGEYTQDIDPHGPDADLIAHAPTDLAALLALCDQLTRERDQARDEATFNEEKWHKAAATLAQASATRAAPLDLTCAGCRRLVGRVLCRWCAKRDEPQG
jgi:hypothetical protein